MGVSLKPLCTVCGEPADEVYASEHTHAWLHRATGVVHLRVVGEPEHDATVPLPAWLWEGDDET